MCMRRCGTHHGNKLEALPLTNMENSAVHLYTFYARRTSSQYRSTFKHAPDSDRIELWRNDPSFFIAQPPDTSPGPAPRQAQSLCSEQSGVLASFWVVLAFFQRLFHFTFGSYDDDGHGGVGDCETGYRAHSGGWGFSMCGET